MSIPMKIHRHCLPLCRVQILVKDVEDNKLRRRPESWRLACQALVEQSVIVLTRPQVRLAELDKKKAAALAEALPAGPTTWPVVEGADDAEEGAEQETAADSAATPSDEG